MIGIAGMLRILEQMRGQRALGAAAYVQILDGLTRQEEFEQMLHGCDALLREEETAGVSMMPLTGGDAGTIVVRRGSLESAGEQRTVENRSSGARYGARGGSRAGAASMPFLGGSAGRSDERFPALWMMPMEGVVREQKEIGESRGGSVFPATVMLHGFHSSEKAAMPVFGHGVDVRQRADNVAPALRVLEKRRGFAGQTVGNRRVGVAVPAANREHGFVPVATTESVGLSREFAPVFPSRPVGLVRGVRPDFSAESGSLPKEFTPVLPSQAVRLPQGFRPILSPQAADLLHVFDTNQSNTVFQGTQVDRVQNQEFFYDHTTSWRELAAREGANRSTTTEVKIDFGGITNHVSSELDLDEIVDYIGEKTAERLLEVAEGVRI